MKENAAAVLKEGGYTDVAIILAANDSTTERYQLQNGTGSIVNDTLRWRISRTDERFATVPDVKIPMSKIKYLEVKTLNGAKTILLTGVLIGTAAAFIAIASMNSGGGSSVQSTSQTGGRMQFSCPLIYTLGDSGYELESETFAGAVFKGIERTSYDLLTHLKPVSGEYKVKLVNARQETEYTNELKLIAVDHSPDLSVIPDASGGIHTVSELIKPVKAVSKDGRDVTAVLSESDRKYFESDLQAVDPRNDNDLVDNVTMAFSKPRDCKKAKIIVTGLNTKLAFFALERIFALQGEERIDWYNQLDSNPKERAKFVGWLMREGMLHISVWNGTTWSERGIILDVGPGVEKTQITVLDIADVHGDSLKISASFRTGLWRLDQVAVDYSPDVPVHSHEIAPLEARDQDGKDVSSLIAKVDPAYYVTINRQYVNISFTVPPVEAGMARTVVAKTSGFYNQWGDSHSSVSQPQTVDSIMTVPLYGSKVFLPMWCKADVLH